MTFSIDSNGIVNVTAKNVATGQMQQMKVSATSGLTKDELEKLVQVAKGRVVSSAPKEEPKKGSDDSAKKGKSVLPEPATSVSASPSMVETHTETEFLTGDMIDSFLKDPDGPRGT